MLVTCPLLTSIKFNLCSHEKQTRLGGISVKWDDIFHVKALFHLTGWNLFPILTYNVVLYRVYKKVIQL